MVTTEVAMANITALPDVALIPTENYAMGFYILIIGELWVTLVDILNF